MGAAAGALLDLEACRPEGLVPSGHHDVEVDGPGEDRLTLVAHGELAQGQLGSVEAQDLLREHCGEKRRQAVLALDQRLEAERREAFYELGRSVTVAASACPYR